MTNDLKYYEEKSVSGEIRRGDIFEYIPIVWQDDRVTIVRTKVNHMAEIHKEDELGDAFQRTEVDNQEEIVVCAKKRPVMVFSSNTFIKRNIRWKHSHPEDNFHISVLPLYSIDVERREFRDKVKGRAHDQFIYFPTFNDVLKQEHYGDFRKIQPVPYGYFEEDKKIIKVSESYLLTIYLQYLRFLKFFPKDEEYVDGT